MATHPLPDDPQLVEKMIAEERVRTMVRASLEQPKPRGLKAILLDRDMIKLLVSAVFIPALVWVAGSVWQKIIDARNKPAIEGARRAAQLHADIEQMTVLLPWIGKPDAEGQIAREVLRSMAEATPSDPAVMRVYMTAKRTAEAQQTSSEPEVRMQGAIAEEGLTTTAPPLATATLTPGSEKTLSPAAASVAANIGIKPKSIFIQIYGESQRQSATNLRDALRAEGIPVPGIQNVFQVQGKDAASAAAVRRYAQRGTAGVRYYTTSDQSAAAYVSTIVNRALPGVAPTRIQDLSNRAKRAAPGVLEIWLPCGTAEGC